MVNKKYKIKIHFKRIFIFFIFLFLIYSCKNEQLKFESPNITISSTNKINSRTGIVFYQIDNCSGFKFQELYALCYDITDTTAQVIKKELVLKNSYQFKDSLILDNLTNKHDYRIVLYLKSNKNIFESNPSVLILSSNYEESYFGIIGCDLYSSSSDEIYMEEYNGFKIKPLHKGQYFLVNIYFSDTFFSKNKYEFKLNNNIPLITDDKYDSNSDHINWGMKIPDDLPSGIYSLDLYINGIKKFTALTKIRILAGTYSDSIIPEIPITLYPSWKSTVFILQNNFYIIYQHDVAYYDMSKNIWVKRNSISFDDENIEIAVTDANFNYNNSLYQFVTCYNKKSMNSSIINLLRYNETEDRWEIITSLPDINDDIFSFRIGEKVYLGYKKSGNKRFWEYNLKENNWKRINDLPNEMNGDISGACSDENSGICMTCFRELWQYLPSTNSWQKLSVLYKGPYLRYSNRIVYDNSYIYLLGGYSYGLPGYPGYQDLADIWRYNLNSKEWEYIYLCQFSYNFSAPKFVYKNKIIMIPCASYDNTYKAEIVF